MFSQSKSFEEKLSYPPERDGFVVRGDGARQHPMHRHRELEMNLVLRGQGQYLLGDRRHDLAPGSLIYLFPAQDHILLTRSRDYLHWIIVWRPEVIARVPEPFPLRATNPAGNFCRSLTLPQTERLAALCAEVQGAADDLPCFNTGLAYLLLLSWRLFSATLPEARGARVHPAVEKAVALLRSSDIDISSASLDQIGTSCGMSGAHLARLFRQQIGVSIGTFRNQQRIQRFLAFVGGAPPGDPNPAPTLLDAALRAGFGSYPQFHRVFCALMGTTPSAFLRGRVP